VVDTGEARQKSSRVPCHGVADAEIEVIGMHLRPELEDEAAGA
jgi:hypothetical protein